MLVLGQVSLKPKKTLPDAIQFRSAVGSRSDERRPSGLHFVLGPLHAGRYFFHNRKELEEVQALQAQGYLPLASQRQVAAGPRPVLLSHPRSGLDRNADGGNNLA